MASIVLDVPVDAPAETVWNALSNTGSAHLVFADVLTACHMEDAEVRVATFVNGLIVRERIIDMDPIRRRVAYTVLNTFEHHGASMQVVPRADGGCHFVWISDVLPHAAADRVRPLMEAGAAALKRTFEAG